MLKSCPFCGVESERTLDHKETCFIRRVLLFNEWLVQRKLSEDYSEPRPYSYEELKDAWNARAERTCKFGEPYEAHEYDGMAWPCTECGYEFDEYAHDCFVFCPKCGAKVVEE